MSVDWGIVPSEPDEPGFRDWLEDAGVTIPSQAGRYPTLDEFVDVLNSFDNLPVHKEHLEEGLWRMSIGLPQTDEFAQVLGSVEKNGLFSFHFYGYSTDEFLMFRIVKELTHACGPIVIYETASATPVVIDPTTDLPDAYSDWNLRYRERHSS